MTSDLRRESSRVRGWTHQLAPMTGNYMLVRLRCGVPSSHIPQPKCPGGVSRYARNRMGDELAEAWEAVHVANDRRG